MIDKLDLKVASLAPLRVRFAELVKARNKGAWIPGVTSSEHYQHVFDLRRFGSDAILHFGFKRDGNRAHKLELVDTGEKRFDELLDQIALVFDVDPYSLDVMRVDLALDIDGISVRWFRRNTRVRFKRHSRRIGKMMVEISDIANCKVETLYFGRTPNCIRIYDKTAQLRAQYVKEHSRLLTVARRARAEHLRASGIQWTGSQLYLH